MFCRTQKLQLNQIQERWTRKNCAHFARRGLIDYPLVYKAWMTTGCVSWGGGTVGRDFRGLTIGDVDKNGYVSLNDAIFIQKYQLGMSETIDELSKRNADANRDGEINLKDTVKVQKYQLGIE